MRGFPFSALVGQDDLRTALLANAVSPAVGGVLVRGERGTAKSTAARALAALLPPVAVVAGCPFSCDPASPDPGCPAGPHPAPEAAERPVRLVELPVGASAERVTGALDLERALTAGERRFEPGLLAAAHRGILYVDEVNLLPDHLVDVLLDAAALGVNHVERDGVGVSHPARFVLVGTMNPEEGELRPQLLDRFGLSVEVRGSPDPAERAEVVRRRLAYEADPDGFAGRFAGEEAALAERVAAARARLPRVRLGERALARITAACAALGVDGLRADIVIARTAIALAALDGREEVEDDDVRRASLLALAHRRRRGPLDPPGLEPEELDAALAAGDEDPPPPEDDGPDAPPPNGAGPGERTDPPRGDFRAPALRLAPGSGPEGRRARSRSPHGRPVADAPGASDLALLPTLRAAAPHQVARGRTGPGLRLTRADLRRHLREGRAGALVVVVLDASGSMAARRRMGQVKGLVLSLLTDAYQRRDRVALVGFRGDGAELLLAPTASVEAAAARLAALPAGGGTPLAAGLDRARELVRAERRREPGRRAVAVVVTDGRANVGPDPADALRRLAADVERVVVVDSEEGRLRLGLAARLAGAAGADHVRLDDLTLSDERGTPRARTRLAGASRATGRS